MLKYKDEQQELESISSTADWETRESRLGAEAQLKSNLLHSKLH